MKTYKFAFYKGRKADNPESTLLDWVICFFTDSPYSHVELVIDSCTGYSISSSPRDNGVRYKTIEYNHDQWDFIEVSLPVTKNEIYAWFSGHIGKKYDTLGAIGVVLPFFRNNKRKWFCTEILGAFLYIPKPWKLSPHDLYELLSIVSDRSSSRQSRKFIL
jgi:hypothetical protein